ncbi:hypothetical protein [Aureispira sp. CCB-E]|uniref:hypothetical protein n=1 Tax=Aureispira sp. CCB-E TaxID=3051121 RepID=UPI002868E5F7|nr:hypothetical protein [Aureispira sp. CCB-E]WMX12306.1 hypothetical protein QP953_15870 [Aureispira sp. CCB-E]
MIVAVYLIIVLLSLLIVIILFQGQGQKEKATVLNFLEFHSFMFDFEERLIKIIEENDKSIRLKLLESELRNYDRIKRHLKGKTITSNESDK